MISPQCSQCRSYVPGKYSSTGFCTRFVAYRGKGRIVHEFAENAREDVTKCGPKGRLFVKKVNDTLWDSLLEDEE